MSTTTNLTPTSTATPASTLTTAVPASTSSPASSVSTASAGTSSATSVGTQTSSSDSTMNDIMGIIAVGAVPIIGPLLQIDQMTGGSMFGDILGSSGNSSSSGSGGFMSQSPFMASSSGQSTLTASAAA